MKYSSFLQNNTSTETVFKIWSEKKNPSLWSSDTYSGGQQLQAEVQSKWTSTEVSRNVPRVAPLLKACLYFWYRWKSGSLRNRTLLRGRKPRRAIEILTGLSRWHSVRDFTGARMWTYKRLKREVRTEKESSWCTLFHRNIYWIFPQILKE